MEAGHGKGPADGIGAVIKRTADRMIANGDDVTDAETMMKVLKTANTTVKLYLVTEKEIETVRELLPKSLKSVPETMKIHQVY